MATNLSTKTLELRNAEAFANSFSSELSYISIGDSTPYLNEASPPQIVQTPEVLSDVLNSMVALKKVTAGEVKLSVPRVDWTSDTKYMQFDNLAITEQLIEGDASINTKPFYVMAPSTRNVYKCLSNGSGSISTVEPTGDYSTSNGVVDNTGSDGYVWKYMYNIRDSDQFVDSNFIPVPTRNYTDFTTSSDTVYSSYSIRNDTVVEGELTTIIVTHPGSGYRDFTNVRTFAFETTNTSTADGLNRTIQITGAFLSEVGLTIDEVASANMTVSGGASLFSEGTFIESVDTVRNKITLTKPVLTNSDGSVSNTISLSTRIFVDGVTRAPEPAEVSAVLGTSGSIQSANVTQFGSKYTDKINVKVFGTATSNIANLRAVLPPTFGHGFDIGKDLFANSVVAVAKFGEIDSTENGVVPTDFSFRQIGLIRNPYKYGANTFTASPTISSNSVLTIDSVDANTVVRQTSKVFVSSGVSYDEQEFVFQGDSSTDYTAGGFVHRIENSTLLEVTELQGELEVGKVLVGSNSAASRVITQIVDPSFEPKAADLLFVDNRDPITRTDGQAESVRLTIRF
jgi:hypothetical protein